MERERITKKAGIVAAVGAALAAYVLLLRPWHLRWGATSAECGERLPGDDLVPYPKSEATHAITIDAPLDEVWPWLVQVGQTRGGFYSYTWLENLVGCHMQNAESIVPEWQSMKEGDEVWLHPKAPPLPVIIFEPYQAIVLGSPDQQETDSIASASGTWGFFLKRVDDKTTRLLARNRWDRKPGLLNWLGSYVLLEPAHFVMERKMMLGIKSRAERAARVVFKGVNDRDSLSTNLTARTETGPGPQR